jgi:hypothetical protein
MRILAIALVALAAGCGGGAGASGSAPADEGTVIVQASMGPTCPVEREDNNPLCRPRPVDNAELAVERPDGSQVARLAVSKGRAQGPVPPGSYVLVPQGVSGLMGGAKPVPFTVKAGETVRLKVLYDTGIR